MKPREFRPRECVICRHKDRARIELLRAGGASLRAITREFGVSKDSIWRHMAGHVSARRKAELLAGPVKIEELANRAASESRSVIEYLAVVRSVLFNAFLAAAEAGDRAGVANVAGRLLEALREVGRITGELRNLSGLTLNQNTINISSSPEFVRLQDGLLRLARTHPAAKSDIVALLRGLAAPSELPAGGLPLPAGRDGAAGSKAGACGPADRPGSLPLIEGEAADADAA